MQVLPNKFPSPSSSEMLFVLCQLHQFEIVLSYRARCCLAKATRVLILPQVCVPGLVDRERPAVLGLGSTTAHRGRSSTTTAQSFDSPCRIKSSMPRWTQSVLGCCSCTLSWTSRRVSSRGSARSTCGQAGLCENACVDMVIVV